MRIIELTKSHNDDERNKTINTSNINIEIVSRTFAAWRSIKIGLILLPSQIQFLPFASANFHIQNEESKTVNSELSPKTACPCK
jgi:hypothetical protein